jgi:hypothetical protein
MGPDFGADWLFCTAKAVRAMARVAARAVNRTARRILEVVILMIL